MTSIKPRATVEVVHGTSDGVQDMAKHREPCLVCSEDTAAGSPLYFDRLVARKDGKVGYLCSLCAERARGSREVHELTEAQRRRFENAVLAFGSFAPGGH